MGCCCSALGCCCRRRARSSGSLARWRQFTRWVLRLDFKRLLWAHLGQLLIMIQEQGQAYSTRCNKKAFRSKPHQQ